MLQTKFLLLQCIQNKQLEKAQILMKQISTSNGSNPHIYAKFHSFLLAHRHEIEAQEKEHQSPIQIQYVSDSDLSDWNSDQQVILSSSSDQEEAPQKIFIEKVPNKHKDSEQKVKRQFLVSTKESKQNARKVIKGIRK